MLARCPVVHNALANCGSFEEQAVNSNVALLGHNRCIARSFCRLTGDATVNSFSLVKTMKSTAYDVSYDVHMMCTAIVCYEQTDTCCDHKVV